MAWPLPLRALGLAAAGLAAAIAALRLVRRLKLQVELEARRPGTASTGHTPVCADELGTRISLEEIYQDGLKTACHRDVSASEIALLESDGGCSAYGDSDVDLVVRVFEEVLGRRLAPADCFYDLGSGDGRLVVSMALFTPCGRSVGIELCPSRHQHALTAQAAASMRGLLKAVSNTGVGGGAGGGGVELYCQSMLEHDLNRASLVFSFNLPEPGGAFLYSMKAHLLRTLAHGACVLLRGQVLPADKVRCRPGGLLPRPLLVECGGRDGGWWLRRYSARDVPTTRARAADRRGQPNVQLRCLLNGRKAGGAAAGWWRVRGAGGLRDTVH